MSTYDVLVIGAGPAGGSAALHCARAGLNTAILEEHESVGEPVHCGECLSQAALDRTGLKPPSEAISLPVKGVRVVFPSGRSPLLTEPGFVLEKQVFEQWLAGEAVNAGAELRLGARVERIERTGGGWRVSASNSGGGSGFFEAQVVIDASGVSSCCSSSLLGGQKFESAVGFQYLLSGIPTDGYLGFYLWPDYCPSGYLWVIPKSGGRANVGLVTGRGRDAKALLDGFLAKMGWEGKERLRSFGGLIPSSGPLSRTVFDGLLLAGDAAGFTSPLFEGGTQLGLVSGRFAAEAAADALSKGDTSAAGLSGYEARWRKEFPDYPHLLKGKNAIHSLSSRELDRLAACLPMELAGMGAAEKALIGLRLLSKPGLFWKGALEALLALGASRAKRYGW